MNPNWKKLRDSLSIALGAIGLIANADMRSNYTLQYFNQDRDFLPHDTVTDGVAELQVMSLELFGPDISIIWETPVHGTEESGKFFLTLLSRQPNLSDEPQPPVYDETTLDSFSAGQERTIAEYVAERLAINFIGKKLDDAEAFREQMLGEES